MKTIAQCGISDATDFHSLWKLPRLPLTERFGPYRTQHDDLVHDQELVISLPTGHVQLRHQLDPRILYTAAEYSFRTAASASARSGTAFFIKFLRQMAGTRAFDSLADVGGNDLFLARELAGYACHRTVIDPICGSIDGQEVEGIRVFGRFIEQLDLGRDLPPPDLLVCRHTLEHIAQPRDVIAQWFKQCRADCLYVAEIPCFENLVEAQRFDAIFHQHFHYYDLNSFRHLIWECGGEYLGHAFNHQGSCGGALLVAFRRAQSPQPKPLIDLAARIQQIERRIARYREQMSVMADLLNELPKPVYGYGASLMLATLGYHLKTDFSVLDCVLDDNPSRDGATYENVPVTVRYFGTVQPQPNSSYLVTSLENIRPIYQRIVGLKPRRILIPLVS
jgi:cyclopropane-fatty-acyl-phospholipid synthase